MREWINIIEGKQVGVLYHFTSAHNAYAIIEGEGHLKPKGDGGFSFNGEAFVIDRPRDWISFTRNPNLIATPAAGGDGREWGEVRIALDGDRLSQRFKIAPYHDHDDRLTRHDAQAEERVMGEMRRFKDAIIQIDFLARRFYENETDFDHWVSPPDEAQREKYREEARKDIETFVEIFRREGIRVNIVDDFRKPVRRELAEATRFTKTDPASVPIDPAWREIRDDAYLAQYETPRLTGPHARREMNLMLAGLKPVAMADGPILHVWQKAAREQGWASREIELIYPGIRGWFFALPGQEWRLDAIDKLYRDVRNKGSMDLRHHARLGLLLGYSKEAILEFLKARKEQNASKR